MGQSEDDRSTREVIREKLRRSFDGKIVRKDLTKHIKEGANVPVYVLEFLLGQYCSTDDEETIAQGVQNVKRILADNFVRPDEAEKIKAVLRKNGNHTVIDMITVKLDIARNAFYAEFSNLGLTKIPIEDEYPEKYDRLLCGGIWCIVQLDYEYVEEEKKNGMPIRIRKLTPIQMPHVDINELKAGRKTFTQDEWMDVLLRSIGMEPDILNIREKWLLLTRMIPLVENNFNFCELGPRSTGKSHLYKEISPNSILISGGQTTVANLFYNMGRKTVGLVGLWDCVAFDEVAGIHFKDNDGVQIMKDYMASGSFARGKEEKAASASMVFVGNINQSVDVLLKTSSLFDPFPPEMGKDTAFLDRMHCYLPGWEIPKFRPEHFTDDYGFITDYLAEFIRELRKEQYGDALDRYFRLGKNLNQRDTIAVRRMVDGYLKLMYPDGEFTKEQLEEVLKLSLEMRRRVKEQLKKLGGMEFYDVNFSYIDLKDMSEPEFLRFICLKPDVICGKGKKSGSKTLVFRPDFCSFFAQKPQYLVVSSAYFRLSPQYVICITVSTVLPKTHKTPDSYINVTVDFGNSVGMIPLNSIVEKTDAYKPKQRITYKLIKEYILEKYSFKVHTAYIAEVKRGLGLPMYDAPNAVEALKQPRKHPTPIQVAAIKDALTYFEVIQN